MSYEQVFKDAFQALIWKYEQGQVRFLDESSLRSVLFFECLDIINSRGLKPKIEPNVDAISGVNWRADLVLGRNDVVCELKFEPRYPRILGWTKKIPVVIWKEVEKDIERIGAYVKAGALAAHFIMIDEDGRWKQKSIEGGWRILRLPDWTSYLAHVTRRRL